MSNIRATREQMWKIFQMVLDSLIEDLKNPNPKMITQAMQFLRNNGIVCKNGADPEDVKDGLLGLNTDGLELEVFESSLEKLTRGVDGS